MLVKEDVLSKLKELKPEVHQEFAVSKLGLFGSFSKDAARDESDIDILVELEHPIGWRFFTLEKHLQEIFDRKIDLVTKNALKEPLREGILKEVIFV